MRFGILLSDVPSSTTGVDQMRDIVRIVDAAQRNGFTTIAVGQHFLYGDLRWLQPVPLLARLAGEIDATTRLATHVIVAPLYHPVILAEELATLDIVSGGRLDVGLGLGYRAEEFESLGVPYTERAARFEESIEVMKLLWQEDRVDFDGRFWTLNGVEPHIRPSQQPHPPLWIGGSSERGARRAGEIGDAYPVPPDATEEQIRDRLAVVRDLFALRGKPFGPQPVRRDILVSSSREAALAEYSRVARGRYLAYARRGLRSHDETELEQKFIEVAETHAYLGTPDEVIEKVRRLVNSVPVDPLILKPQWPGMSADETIAAIVTLGETVVDAFRDFTPRQDISAR